MAWQNSTARLACLARDGYRCRGCNSPERLEVHHRTYERLYNEEVDDLTTLCHECHESITTIIRRRRYQIFRPTPPAGVQEQDCPCGAAQMIACLTCDEPLCDRCYDVGEGRCEKCRP